ncbi:MAG: hypothetical protein M3439_01370 [Chloroflexota bacterium]|nr:hypothetical protein [Chloroflexota bacterium]
MLAENLSVLGSDTDDGIPEPEGGSHISQDVGTLVGQPAPSFQLENAEGESFAVIPGNDQPIVLIFHMGIT